jgi:hypothetical protein
LYRRLGRPHGRSGLGLNSRTVQLIASRYIDRAIAAHSISVLTKKFVIKKKTNVIIIIERRQKGIKIDIITKEMKAI